jgi:glycosyltransferase involved in cell wall biosynthesis
MRIAFISLMRILPWGGSEELWHKTAKFFFEKGYIVNTLTQLWPETPSKIAELQALGINTYFYYTPYYTLIERVGIKFKLKNWSDISVPALDADVYFISNGSIFDFVYNRSIIEKVVDFTKQYILIHQHNWENGNILPDMSLGYTINVINKAKHNFFVSKRNQVSAERQIPIRFNNASVISNPLNISDFGIKDFPKQERLSMACVARLDCAVKGQDILIEVLSSDKWKNRDFHLGLYGSGPHLGYINRLIKFYSLEDKVSVIGYVQNIDELWKKNQVLILPSLSEGTPLAMVEAMISGRGVVTTDVGGNSDYVLEGKTGFLADVASLKCLDRALEEMWNCKHLLEHIGKNAHDHALSITNLNPSQLLLDIIEN